MPAAADGLHAEPDHLCRPANGVPGSDGCHHLPNGANRVSEPVHAVPCRANPVPCLSDRLSSRADRDDVPGKDHRVPDRLNLLSGGSDPMPVTEHYLSGPRHHMHGSADSVPGHRRYHLPAGVNLLPGLGHGLRPHLHASGGHHLPGQPDDRLPGHHDQLPKRAHPVPE